MEVFASGTRGGHCGKHKGEPKADPEGPEVPGEGAAPDERTQARDPTGAEEGRSQGGT